MSAAISFPPPASEPKLLPRRSPQAALLALVEGAGARVTMVYACRVAAAFDGHRYLYEADVHGRIWIIALDGADRGKRIEVANLKEFDR